MAAIRETSLERIHLIANLTPPYASIDACHERSPESLMYCTDVIDTHDMFPQPIIHFHKAISEYHCQ